MTTLTDIDKEIAELTKKLDKLVSDRDALMSLSKEQQIAIHLHDTTCNMNHIDQCAWFCEGDNWGKLDYVHMHYLQRANNLVALFEKNNISTDVALACAIIDAVR